MNQTSELGEGKLSRACNKLFGMCNQTVKAEYDRKIETYPDENCETPSCSHSFKGSAKHNLLRVALAIGAVAATVTVLKMIIRACCALCCRGK